MDIYFQSNQNELELAVKNRSKWLIDKIQKYRENKLTDEERSHISLEYILEQIRNKNILICSIFRKDPLKQGIHEKSQIQHLKQYHFPDLIKPSCVYLNNGNIENGNHKIIRPFGATKTFDCYSPSKDMYGICKYTKQAGGSQDNQYKDVKHFLEQILVYFEKHPKSPTSFHFYLDGKYYNTKRRNALISHIPMV
jgi:hypothetical protein